MDEKSMIQQTHEMVSRLIEMMASNNQTLLGIREDMTQMNVRMGKVENIVKETASDIRMLQRSNRSLDIDLYDLAERIKRLEDMNNIQN